MLPKYPVLKHSLDRTSLINARKKNKAGKDKRVLVIRTEGGPFLRLDSKPRGYLVGESILTF